VSGTFRLPLALHRWMRRYARRRHLSMNQVVVDALEALREATEGPAQ
jgi:hypothetical protein